MKFTIFGGRGFIGSHLLQAFEEEGVQYEAPARENREILNRNLGHVIYAIGLTADFRARAYDTVRAHVSHLMDLLENLEFESFLYLSSTRVYLKGHHAHEDSDVCVNSNDPEDLYNLSKLMGESLCLASGRANVRVARLSNVFGKKVNSSDFLSSVIIDALEKGKVFLKSGLASEKDYISVHDVVRLLPKISVSGQYRLYNVARGENTRHQTLFDVIQNITGCEVEVAEDVENRVFPKISIRRIQEEFDFYPKPLIPVLRDLIPQYAMRVIHD